MKPPTYNPAPMSCTVAVVIPSYRVKDHVLDVIARIGAEVHRIYVVDDACPDGSGRWVREHCSDPRVRVLEHAENQGVGGAVMTGYRAAIEEALRSALVDGLGLKPRNAFGPVRVAITGSTVSPPLFESMELLGRERSLARLAAAG